MCERKGGVVWTCEESAELRDVPTIGLDYMYMHSEQEKEEEKGMPIVVATDSKTKMIMARVSTSKGLGSSAVETVKKMVERLGHKKIIMKSDNEPAILAPKEAVRRDRVMWRL